MNKIDRRHIYGIMLDTETANTIEDNGKLDMSNVLVGKAIIMMILLSTEKFKLPFGSVKI